MLFFFKKQGQTSILGMTKLCLLKYLQHYFKTKILINGLIHFQKIKILFFSLFISIKKRKQIKNLLPFL